ncbi:hypothetical protein FACS1894137_14480 [Spirochaetia bacterium]|nr:hypothetical protein FACS1894137_14480 [Spirochaetia bacterium]
MNGNNLDWYSQPVLEKGFSGKGYVTQVIQGKPVKIPTSQLNIIPPKAGTAAVTPKK